jgi:hypothetical protein
MQQTGDEKKLAILLRHWVEHNDGHAREFKDWAGKVRKSGRETVSEDIAQAAEQLNHANELLLAALEKLKEA